MLEERPICENFGFLLTALLRVSACSASSRLTAVSTLAMVSVAGVTAKFSPFFSRAISASPRDLEDKLITQLIWLYQLS